MDPHTSCTAASNLRPAPALVTVIQCLLLLMGNCVTYLWEIVSPTYGNCFTTSSRTLTKVFSDANLFSNLVTIDLLSELYLMGTSFAFF